MIRVRVGRTGYVPIEFSKFPDGTSSFRFPIEKVGGSGENAPITVEWKYDGDHECILLWYLVKHIQYLYDQPIRLYLPYIPNARMDRVKSPDEVFTLKWFSQFVNALGFSEVVVCDPHSDVSTALIDNVIVRQQAHADVEVLTRRLSEENLLFCYPDEGAAKRYSGVFQREYVFCIKHRDWRTGKIQRLELTEPDKVKGRNILIVDDICSRGGTFTHTAKALKDAGAQHIYLYVTHCENTIFDGAILTDGLIDKVFTTNSIFRGEHEKIEVFRC